MKHGICNNDICESKECIASQCMSLASQPKYSVSNGRRKQNRFAHSTDQRQRRPKLAHVNQYRDYQYRPRRPEEKKRRMRKNKKAQELEQKLQAERIPASIINNQIGPFLLEDEWILSRRVFEALLTIIQDTTRDAYAPLISKDSAP